MTTAVARPTPIPLPETTAAMLAMRKLKSKRTLNDLVEDAHVALFEDENYVRFLEATYDEQAVEGSLAADNLEAARMIRKRAKDTHVAELANQKLATISKALGIVLRRYNISRNDRRNMVGGVVVGDE